MAGKSWHYAVNGETKGPVSSRELSQLAEAGTLTPEDLVWKEGSADWVPASTVKGLKFGSSPPVASPPLVSQPAAPPPAPVPAPATPAPSAPPPSTPVPPAESPQVAIAPNLVTAPASPATGTAKKNAGLNLIVVVAIAVVLCAATGVGAFLIGQSASGGDATADSGQKGSSTSDSSEDDKSDSRADALHKELEGERDDIRDEIKDLKKERDTLEEKNRKLDQENKKLEKEINQLVSRLDTIGKWETADFVMVNPTDYSLAMRDTPAGIVLENKATGEAATDTIAASRGWDIPRIQDDRALTREIYNAVDVGDTLPTALASRVREFWRPYRFVPADPDATPNSLTYVSFRDAVTFENVVGFLSRADGDGIEYYTIGKEKKKIPYSRIHPGSARQGRAEDVLDTLSDMDFLDYCLLKVAQKLGTPGSSGNPESGYRRVGVRVEVDIPTVKKAFGSATDKALNSLIHPDHPFVTFFALMGKKHNFDRVMKSSQQELALYVRDEILSKLTAMDIPVFEDNGSWNPLDPFDVVMNQLQLANGTHAVSVKLKDATHGGQFHLSVRLHDATGTIIWAGDGERDKERLLGSVPNANYQYHVNSGTTSLIYLKKDHAEGFIGQEEPPVVEPLKVRSAKERYSHLVYLETPPDSPVLTYRTLFSKDTQTVEREHVEKIVPVTDIKQVPIEHLMRYLVSQIASRSLPPAGRVLDINHEANHAVISLGRRHGIDSGDRIRILRVSKKIESLYDKGSYGLHVPGGEALLPTNVVVSEAGDDYSRVVFADSGFEDVWPENVPIQKGDLVVGRVDGSQVLAVVSPLLIPPAPNIITMVGLNKPIVQQKFTADGRATSVRFAQLLQSGLTRVNVPVVETKYTSARYNRAPEPIIPPEATHRVYGTITLSSKMKTNVGSFARPIYRYDLKIGPTESKEVLGVFEFDMDDLLRPTRK